jgi:hypothetical protein
MPVDMKPIEELVFDLRTDRYRSHLPTPGEPSSFSSYSGGP